MTAAAPAPRHVPCPYVGLAPFTEAESRFFFGRERDARIIAVNARAVRVTVVCGAAGVGKTSILLAKVVPALRMGGAAATTTVVVRDWQGRDARATVSGACLQALADAGVASPAPETPLDGLIEALARAARAPVFLLFDQFEEYLIGAAQRQDADAFEDELARTVNREDLPVSILLSMRDDSLAELDRLGPRIPNLLANVLRIDHLDAQAGEDAIRKPLEVFAREGGVEGKAVQIEDALIGPILEQVRIGRNGTAQTESGVRLSSERIETPFLQLVLVRLWREDIDSGGLVLRHASFVRLGGARQIVRRYLDDVMERLTAAQREVSARLFDRMVTPTGNKVACTPDDLAQYGGSLASEVPAVVEVLRRARILQRVPPPPNQPDRDQYQIFHDVLAAAISGWRRRYLEDRERGARTRKRQQRMAIAAAVALAAALFGGAAWGRSEAKRVEGFGRELLQRQEYRLAAEQFSHAASLYGRALDIRSAERARSEATEADDLARPWGFLVDLGRPDVMELHANAIRIGRDVPAEGLVNEISYSDRSISRRHAEIRRGGDRLRDQYVEDSRSTNGTSVNAEFLHYGKTRDIKDGDVIVLGGVKALQFRGGTPTRPDLPAGAWAVVVRRDGRTGYLVDDEASVLLDSSDVRVERGHQEQAALWIRRRDGVATMMDRPDGWALETSVLVPGQLNALAGAVLSAGLCPELGKADHPWAFRPGAWAPLSTAPVRFTRGSVQIPLQFVLIPTPSRPSYPSTASSRGE